jgi:hypothetical protein
LWSGVAGNFRWLNRHIKKWEERPNICLFDPNFWITKWWMLKSRFLSWYHSWKTLCRNISLQSIPVVPKLFQPRHTKMNIKISRHPFNIYSNFFHERVGNIISYDKCNDSVQWLGLFLIPDKHKIYVSRHNNIFWWHTIWETLICTVNRGVSAHSLTSSLFLTIW